MLHICWWTLLSFHLFSIIKLPNLTINLKKSWPSFHLLGKTNVQLISNYHVLKQNLDLLSIFSFIASISCIWIQLHSLWKLSEIKMILIIFLRKYFKKVCSFFSPNFFYFSALERKVEWYKLRRTLISSIRT